MWRRPSQTDRGDMMRATLLATLLCVLLANTAWGVWEVQCTAGARMDAKICNLFGTDDGKVGLGFTVRGASGMIVAYGPELVLDRQHEHVIRVDQHQALRSDEVEARMVIFYEGLQSTDAWNRIASTTLLLSDFAALNLVSIVHRYDRNPLPRIQPPIEQP
jgi:hypothetical protein